MKSASLFLSVFVGLFWTEPRLVGAAGEPANGKALYEKHCLVCHGPQGKGDGPVGVVLKPPDANFTSAGSKKKSDAELRQVVENGRPGTAMSPWKNQLSQAELNDLLAYVLTLR